MQIKHNNTITDTSILLLFFVSVCFLNVYFIVYRVIVLLYCSYSKILLSIFSVLYIISTFITYMRLRNNALMYLCIKNFVFMIYTSTLRTYLRTCTHVLPNKKAIYITQYSAALSLLFKCINCKKLEFSVLLIRLYVLQSNVSDQFRYPNRVLVHCYVI